MLADFELSQMKPERLRLPDKMLEFPERLAVGTRAHQRLLHHAKIREEVPCPGIGKVGMS